MACKTKIESKPQKWSKHVAVCCGPLLLLMQPTHMENRVARAMYEKLKRGKCGK